jgi:hypothetical protein
VYGDAAHSNKIRSTFDYAVGVMPARRSSSITVRRVLFAIAICLLGAALLIWQVRAVGVDQITQGLSQIGWGFAVILALSLARFTLRSIAWCALMSGRLSLRNAVGATLAGDAIGNLTPLSLLVSEPAKSMYVRDEAPVSSSFAALTAENFFYSVSVAIFILLGTITMLAVFAVPPDLRTAGFVSLGLMLLVLLGAVWVGWSKPALLSGAVARIPFRGVAALLDRVRRFEASTYALTRGGGRLPTVIACEIAFHVLSLAESYYTIWLITGRSLVVAALVLDTFNRIVNVVFRAMPLRAGVDEYSTAIVAPAVGLTSAVGVTIALVRKGRMLVWAGVGAAIAVRKGITLRDAVALPAAAEER